MGSISNNSSTYTSVSGVRTTGNVGASVAIRDVEKAMVTFQPYRFPILAHLLTQKFGKAPTGNRKFEWTTSIILPQTGTITLAGGSTTETVTAANLGDITLFQLGTVITVDSTQENLVVTTLTGSTSVVLTKVGAGNITAATSQTYHILGEVFGEGESSATSKSVNKNFVYNYCQIFKKSVHVTRSEMATSEYGDQEWNRQKRDMMLSWSLNMEKSLLFAKGKQFASGIQANGGDARITGGIFYGGEGGAYINGVDTTATAGFSEDYFFKTFLKNAFAKGSPNKRMYAGGSLKANISSFSRAKNRTLTGETSFGNPISTIEHDFGTLEVVWHPMLDGSIYTNWGAVLDLSSDYIKYKYLSANGMSRDVNFEEFPYLEEQDQRKGQWIAECGWQITGDDYHYLYKPAA